MPENAHKQCNKFYNKSCCRIGQNCSYNHHVPENLKAKDINQQRTVHSKNRNMYVLKKVVGKPKY